MATRLKTVQYAFPTLPSLLNNTLTGLTGITLYLPESGKTFRSVVMRMSAQITGTTAGNLSTRRLDGRLGAAGFASNNNTTTYTGSGEDIHIFHDLDITSHFTTNWTGTSMTFDSQVQLTFTGGTPAITNVCVTIAITYEYDDTSATQVKTVYIPLDAPVGALATAKPGTAVATIPALNTDLPEASKVYRNQHIVVQGNITSSTGTTDQTLTMQLDATASHTSGIFEAAQATDYWFRYVWDCSEVLDESISMGFYIWSSQAKMNHLQTYLVVTYEFDATANTGCRVSLMLPMDLHSPMGGTTSENSQRGTRSLWIEEPGTITTKQIAFYPFWTQIAAIYTLNMRIGSGSFVTYTDTASVLAGSNGAMVRNDEAFTLNRGENELTFDIWRSDTADFGWGLSGFWIVNYNCSQKPINGFGSENHTIFGRLFNIFTGAAANTGTSTSNPYSIPDTDYYINSVGALLISYPNSTSTYAGVVVSVERLAAEGGIEWEPIISDFAHADPESGLYTAYGQNKALFKRWPGDLDPNRLDLETSRRWKWDAVNIVGVFLGIEIMITYHSQIYTVSGTVSGYADADGAGLTVKLHRTGVGEYSEVVKETTTTAGGAFSFSWYDNTQNVFVSCYEDATHVGSSAPGLAV